MKPWKVIAAAALVVALACAGNSDYENQTLLEKQYEENVCSGAWPDYKERKPRCAYAE